MSSQTNDEQQLVSFLSPSVRVLWTMIDGRHVELERTQTGNKTRFIVFPKKEEEKRKNTASEELECIGCNVQRDECDLLDFGGEFSR